MRRWGVPPLGDGVGGAGTHWNGVTWRFARANSCCAAI